MNSKVYQYQSCIRSNFSYIQHGTILSFAGWESGRCVEENGGTNSSSLFKETEKYEPEKTISLIKIWIE